MFNPIFRISNQTANALTAVEHARGFLEAATLSQEWLEAMQNKALILEAHHTTQWLEYFSEGLATQLREIKDLGKQVIKQSVLAKQYHLSERQKLAIDYMMTEGNLSIQQFERMCPDVTRRTLQRELKDLIDKGLVMSSGATSNLIYQLKEKS